MQSLHDKITNKIPQLRRRLVWCRHCGRGPVRVENGLSNGWPKCCGYTMTIDSPEEQAALKSTAAGKGEG